MAGGIDWFRWHHGSVTDPKFQLVAKKAGARLGDVITVWAFILEKASTDADRGSIGALDFESLDFLLGAEDGTSCRIMDAMAARGLVTDMRIAAWDKRQPKRERDDDLTATERKRAQRERERSAMSRQHDDERRDNSMSGGVTQSHAMSRHVTPCHAESHLEKRREEVNLFGTLSDDESGSSVADAPAKKRAARLPADWVLSKSCGDWALKEFPGWTADDVRAEAEKFADHWHSVGGKTACRIDWDATWRNWCRNAGDRRSRSPYPQQAANGSATSFKGAI